MPFVPHIFTKPNSQLLVHIFFLLLTVGAYRRFGEGNEWRRESLMKKEVEKLMLSLVFLVASQILFHEAHAQVVNTYLSGRNELTSQGLCYMLGHVNPPAAQIFLSFL